MQIINKDILEIETGIIGQQVNCQKVMGKGLALCISRKYPVVKEHYWSKQTWKLGDVQLIQVKDGLWIANMAGQDKYGYNGCFTDYLALEFCLYKVNDYSKTLNLPLYLPYKLGCGLAGGDWLIVSDIINRVCPNACVCKKE